MQDGNLRLCDCDLCVREGLTVRCGDCHCGCDEPAPISPQTVRKLGYVAGKPRTFIRNHDKRQRGPRYYINSDGCWVFTGTIGPKGYGAMRKVGDATRMYPAHRVFYEQAKGPIPEGLQLDHLCHNPDTCVGGSQCPHRRCVNPDHLEPVTNRENNARGQTRPGSTQKPGRKKKAKPTHCKHGHEFTPENTIIRPNGWWRCRTCQNAQMLAYYYRTRGAKP